MKVQRSGIHNGNILIYPPSHVVIEPSPCPESSPQLTILRFLDNPIPPRGTQTGSSRTMFEEYSSPKAFNTEEVKVEKMRAIIPQKGKVLRK